MFQGLRFPLIHPPCLQRVSTFLGWNELLRSPNPRQLLLLEPNAYNSSPWVTTSASLPVDPNTHAIFTFLRKLASSRLKMGHKDRLRVLPDMSIVAACRWESVHCANCLPRTQAVKGRTYSNYNAPPSPPPLDSHTNLIKLRATHILDSQDATYPLSHMSLLYARYGAGSVRNCDAFFWGIISLIIRNHVRK